MDMSFSTIATYSTVLGTHTFAMKLNTPRVLRHFAGNFGSLMFGNSGKSVTISASNEWLCRFRFWMHRRGLEAANGMPRFSSICLTLNCYSKNGRFCANIRHVRRQGRSQYFALRTEATQYGKSVMMVVPPIRPG